MARPGSHRAAGMRHPADERRRLRAPERTLERSRLHEHHRCRLPPAQPLHRGLQERREPGDFRGTDRPVGGPRGEPRLGRCADHRGALPPGSSSARCSSRHSSAPPTGPTRTRLSTRRHSYRRSTHGSSRDDKDRHTMTAESINIEPIDRWIAAVVDAGATDLMLTPYSPPRMRVDGRLRPIPGEPALDAEACRVTIVSMLSPELRDRLHQEKEIDFSFSYQDEPPVPRELLHHQRLRRVVAACDPARHPDARGAPAPERAGEDLRDAAGLRARDRTDRIGQVDHARVVHRLHQRDARGAHPDRRGPDRIRARAQAVCGQPARGGCRHPHVRPGVALGTSRRPRRHPRRRDARSRRRSSSR